MGGKLILLTYFQFFFGDYELIFLLILLISLDLDLSRLFFFILMAGFLSAGYRWGLLSVISLFA